MQYAALLFLAVVQVCLGVVFGYRRRSQASQAFILLAVVLLLWNLANVTLDASLNGKFFHDPEVRLLAINWANRLGFFFGASVIAALNVVVSILFSHKAWSRSARILTFLGVLAMVASLFPAVSGRYIADLQNPGGKPVYEYGPFASIVTTYYLVAILSIIATSVRSLRRDKDPATRSQIKTVVWSLAVGAFFGVLTILILPTFFSVDALLFLGYFTPYIMVAGIFYSIFRQGLLGFRASIIRSVAYILSLAALIVLYVVMSYELSRITSLNESGRVIAQTITVVFAAVTYAPIKTFFDKKTNKLFFKDAYDTQELLEQLNQVLISTLDLEALLSRSSAIISGYMRSEFTLFGLKGIDEQTRRLIGDRSVTFSADDIDFVQRSTPQLGEKVIIVDEIQEVNRKLHAILSRNKVGALVRLTDSIDIHEPGMGYIVVGEKLSGVSFSRQDQQALTVIGDEYVIAIQNALRFEEIKQFSKTLQHEVDNATRQLKRANDKLVALNDTKDDFISMASHQLRTPLTAVKGNISMIMDGDFGKIPNTVKDPLGQAYASSERMVGLIADLLNVSRLRTGKFAIQPVPSNLDAVVKSELKQLQEAAKAHKLKLTYHGPKTFPVLMMDEIKIRQVIMNFIDNAIYYTPSGGGIDVKLRQTPDAIELTVVDTGIGVPRHLQHNLFTKFYRADNAQKMRPDGTGIGLFMAKKVIVASGGSVIFKSVEGKGSTFGFTIPLSKLPKPAVNPDQTSE